MKKCPYCAEEIQDAAIFCRHCSQNLPYPTLSTSVKNTKITFDTNWRKRYAPLCVIAPFLGLFLGYIFSKNPAKHGEGISMMIFSGKVLLIYFGLFLLCSFISFIIEF